MENIYLFKNEQNYLSKLDLLALVLTSLAGIFIPLVVFGFIFFYMDLSYFYLALWVLGMFFLSILSTWWLYRVLKNLYEKCHTIQMKPGGIVFTNDHGEQRFIPVSFIQEIKLASIQRLTRKTKEKIDVYLMVYSIVLRGKQSNKEIRFKEFSEDGRNIRLKFDEDFNNNSKKYVKQIHSLDRSDEFMHYIGLMEDENTFKAN